MKNLKLFETSSEVGSGVKVETPNVSYLDGRNIVFISDNFGDEAVITYDQENDKIEYEKFVISAVVFTAKQANSTIGLSKLSTGQTLEYSTDEGANWNEITTAITVTLSSVGDNVYIRGVLSSNNTFENYTQFTMSGNIKASGNINYLWNKDNPDVALKQRCGYLLFNRCTALTDASELILPATTLVSQCYYYMFRGASLTTAPVLPATTLAQSCYGHMFDDCTSLTTAPELPATTLAEYCYDSMFSGCTSLTTVPSVLPATTLVYNCYRQVFISCSSLTTAPELPATTLTDMCYYEMFRNCTNLNYIKCLATDISAGYCTSNWVYGVASSGTFIKNPSMSSWTTGNYGIPSNWDMYDNLPIESISISGETNVMNSATYGVTYTPSDTFETGVTWSIISGSQYATIDSNTGVLTVLSGASSSEVVIKATSIVNSAITAQKVLSVSYIIIIPALVFTAKQANSTIGLSNKSTGQTLEYSIDEGTNWSAMTTGTTVTLSNSGDSVYVRGVLSSSNNRSNITKFKMSGNIKASGNINYLWNKNDPDTALKNFCGFKLFHECTALTDASELILPATTLAQSCYGYMFGNCSGLTTAPILPATTLALECYEGMFNGCTSLTTAPILPATSQRQGCYKSMFAGCTSLTTAPELPMKAITAADVYYGMFSGCTSLNYIKCLATNINDNYCTYKWVIGVASSGTFVKDQSMTSWTTGDNGIPTSWTVEDAV